MKLKYVLLAILALIVAIPVGGYIYLTTLDFETLKAQVERQVEKATGRQLSLEGPVELSIGLQPAVTVDRVSLANAQWGSRPHMVTLERFELELELMPLLGGDVKVNRVVLVGPDILMETSPDGQANWNLTGGPEEPAGAGETEEVAQTGEGPAIPEVVAVEIRNGQIVYRDGATGETLTLALDRLELTQLPDGQQLDLAASFQGAEIALAGQIGAVREVIEDTQFPIDLSGTVAGNQVSVSGVVERPQTSPKPDLKIAVSGDSLASFAPLAGGAEIPPLGPYSLEGRTVIDGQAYGLDGLKLTLGESDVSGSVMADLSGERPRIVADLTAAVLNVQDFQAGEAAAPDGRPAPESGQQGGRQAGGEGQRYVIPDTPLPLDALETADATVTLKAGVLRVDPQFELSDVTVGVALAGGDLQVDPLQAAYQQSRMEGRVGLDASGETPQLATQIAVDDFDFGRALNEQGLTDEVEGTMDIRLDLTGAGASPRAIASTLNGTTEVVNEGGKISNKLLAIVGADFTQILGPLLGGEDTTALNCIVSRFDIADGLATSQAMVLDTATFSLAGTGDVNLASEELDLTFDTGTRVPALVSLAIPFKVQGTLANPRVIPDPVGALKGIAGAAATISNPLAVLGAVAGGQVLEGATGGGDQPADNPCLVALDPDAQAAAGAEAPATEPAVPNPVEDVGQAVQDLVPEGAPEEAGQAIEEGVERLRGLFGNQ
jgi:hypothetical protein